MPIADDLRRITEIDRKMLEPQARLLDLINLATGFNEKFDPLALSAGAAKAALSNIEKAALPSISRIALGTDRLTLGCTPPLLQHERMLNTAATLSAAHKAAAMESKSLLRALDSIQPKAELYRQAQEALCGNLLKDINAFTNGVNFLQRFSNIAGLERKVFQDSYLRAIETVSGRLFPHHDFMFESVRRTIENQSDSLMKAAQVIVQDIPKDLLSGTNAALDLYKSNFLLQSETLNKAIAPFVSEWSSLVCEARLVSVGIDHEERHLLYAEYDRHTVLELLTAKLALEKVQPAVSVDSSGELTEPNNLFECSGEHSEHQAYYRGETILTSKDNSTIIRKTLIQALRELQEDGDFTDEEWEQLETDARRAELFVRKHFGNVVHLGILHLIELAVLHVKENPVSADEFRARQEKSLAGLRKLLPKPTGGRPKGTGLFKDTDDFLTALKEVFEKARKKPSQRETLHAIRQHDLCQKQTSEFPSQNQTKTLRNWLDKCEITYEESLEMFWKPAQKGK